MAKKTALVTVLAMLIAGSIFAQEEGTALVKRPGFISIGVGEYFTGEFGGGIDGSIETPYVGGGGFVFLDATYAELSLGIFGAGGKFTPKGDNQSRDPNVALMGLDIGLLGKYPFALNDKLALYPLLGINYRFILSAKDADENQHKNSGRDLSALWFKLGFGLDFFVTDKMYIRYVENYGIRLANAFENDASADALLGHGFEAKFAVGYRF
jgi:opacity protein-like surface antigen